MTCCCGSWTRAPHQELFNYLPTHWLAKHPIGTIDMYHEVAGKTYVAFLGTEGVPVYYVRAFAISNENCDRLLSKLMHAELIDRDELLTEWLFKTLDVPLSIITGEEVTGDA